MRYGIYQVDMNYCLHFQANQYDRKLKQHDYFVYKHHWVLAVDSDDDVDMLAGNVGNIYNVLLIVPERRINNTEVRWN